jgi:hypothetical protein
VLRETSVEWEEMMSDVGWGSHIFLDDGGQRKVSHMQLLKTGDQKGTSTTPDRRKYQDFYLDSTKVNQVTRLNPSKACAAANAHKLPIIAPGGGGPARLGPHPLA